MNRRRRRIIIISSNQREGIDIEQRLEVVEYGSSSLRGRFAETITIASCDLIFSQK